MAGTLRKITAALCLCICAGTSCAVADSAAAQEMALCHAGAAIPVFYVPDRTGGTPPLERAANLLTHDLKARCGEAPAVKRLTTLPDGPAILIGRAETPDIARLLQKNHIDAHRLSGAWERYGRALLPAQDGHGQILLIFGSDTRGTIWGVIDLSREIGVSAWQWWADVRIRRNPAIRAKGGLFFSKSPGVKYRALFLNDEDFGLFPWAAKTFDPKTHDIGPKTYARIFELMWRLKANTIWPAMHNITTSFNLMPGNVAMADSYAIVHGTSHAEPMLRTNLQEWTKSRGVFNFLTNRKNVLEYWDQSIRAHRQYENLYTVGMRGIHDGPMIGVSGAAQARDTLAEVIRTQRKILSHDLGKPADQIPQIFVPYKEVLTAYDAGLSLPDDITLVWPDDNHGYIRRLSNTSERKRSGGSGIYYHISYWGAPASYLWLASTSPLLVWEEMNKAYRFDARRIWVLNAGDIKPGEYLTQLFFDMAFAPQDYQTIASVPRHLLYWMAQTFGPDNAVAATDILQRYYALNQIRRPEFMAWSSTYPTTAVKRTAFNPFAFGDEVRRRIDAWRALDSKVKALAAKIPPDRRDAFFELIGYPVGAASAINRRILDRDTSITYGLQRRASANIWATRAAEAQDSLDWLTAQYNTTLADGKWRFMMSDHPQNLPVFAAPSLPHWSAPRHPGCALEAGGDAYFDGGGVSPALPAFHPELSRRYFVDLFSKTAVKLTWRAAADKPWIHLSRTSGTFDPTTQRLEQRIWVSVDPAPDGGSGKIHFTCNGQSLPLKVSIAPEQAGGDFIEENRIVSIYAAHARSHTGWDTLPGPGSAGEVLRSPLTMASLSPAAAARAPELSYTFSSETANDLATLRVFTLPTAPVTTNNQLRLWVQIDRAAPQILDLSAEEFSAHWRQNVLRNMAESRITDFKLKPGKHVLRVRALDPGIIIDRFEIAFDGALAAYGPVPETRRTR